MGLFNFNRNKNKAQTSAETTTSWEQMANSTAPAQNADLERERQIIADRQRQERKAIGMILYGDSAITASGDDIDEHARLQAYEQITSGQFGPAEQSAILQRIAPPNKAHGGTSQEVFAQMGDKHSRTILAFVNGMTTSQENLWNMSSTIIEATLDQYPTPVEFNVEADEFISRLRACNPESKVQEYLRDLEVFKHTLYGKRQEYYEAFQRVEAEAARHAAAQTKRTKVLDAIHGASTPESKDQFAYPEEDLGYLAPEMQEVWRIPPAEATPAMSETRPAAQEAWSVPPVSDADFNALRQPAPREAMRPRLERIDKPAEVYRMNRKEIKQFLKEGRIDSDPFMQDGQGFLLTTEYLERAGLAPEYKFELDEQTEVALSKVYETQGGRDAVTAYVRTPKGTQVVSYYRSNSQGTWRYLPDYVTPDSTDGSSIEWFGKGYSEESLNLPVRTQQALEIISTQPHLQPDGKSHMLFAFAGTAKRYRDKDAYRDAMNNKTLRGTFYDEVASTPAISFGALSRNKVAPESLQLPQEFAPDFNQPGQQFTFQSGVYGQVSSEHYSSADQRLLWTFNRDAKNHAWIGGVEVEAPISSAGLRTQWAQVGDFGTPLYEYQSVASGYGDPSDKQGSYTSMWKNYLSRIPIIKQYLARKSVRS